MGPKEIQYESGAIDVWYNTGERDHQAFFSGYAAHVCNRPTYQEMGDWAHIYPYIF